jgi:hypothetical protein
VAPEYGIDLAEAVAAGALNADGDSGVGEEGTSAPAHRSPGHHG